MTTNYVKTIGSGGDYSTLQLWYDGIGTVVGSQNLVTADATMTGKVIGNITDNLTTSSTAYSCDSTRFITLTGNSSESYSSGLVYNTANGPSITSTTSPTIHIDAAAAYFHLTNLQIAQTSGARTVSVASCPNLIIDSCVIAMIAGSSQLPLDTSSGGVSTTIRNCLIYLSGTNNCILYAQSGDTTTFQFCTFVVPSDNVGISDILNIPGTPSFTNCAIFGGGTTSTFQTGGGSPTYSHCASDFTGTLPTGVAGPYTYANQFRGTTIAGGPDFREKNSSANLYGAGVTIGGITTDIAGTTRKSPPDIGAWEIASAPPSGGPAGGGMLMFGIAGAIWAANKMGENPILTRRRLLLPK